MIMQTIKKYLVWLWLVSVPLLLTGFACSVFFVGTDSPLLAPAIISLLAFAALSLFPGLKNGWAIPRSYTFLFVMLFWFWLLASLFWSTVPYVSTIFTIILSILPALFAVFVLAQNAQEWTRIHVLALWLAMVAFAFWALVQFLFLFDQYGPRIHHPFLDPNSMAGLLNLGIAPAIGIFMLAKNRWKMIASVAVLSILYAGLVVTQSRAGFFSCSIASVILLAFCIFRNPDGFPWKKLLFILALAVLVPLIGNSQETLENLVRPTIQETFMETRSLEDRFYLWESTAKMIKDHFWLGTGLATFYFYYPHYRLPLDRSDGFFAHMDPLQFWAETGVMTPLLFYSVLVCILLRTIKAVRAPGIDMRGRLEIVAPFCGMLALTGHAHLNYHLYMPGMLLPLAAMLAYWYLATEKVIGDFSTRIFWKPEGVMKKITIAAMGIVIFFTAGWIIRASAATHMIGQVQKEAAANHREKSERLLSLSGIIAPGSFNRYYEYEARTRLASLWNKSGGMNQEQVKKIYEETMYYLDEAEKRNPVFTTIWDLRARLFYTVDGIVLDDGYERADILLKKVIDWNPLATESRIALATMYKSRGDIQKAIYILESGAQWPRSKGRTDLSFLITLANLKLQTGDQVAYDAYMQEAQRRAQSYGMTIK